MIIYDYHCDIDLCWAKLAKRQSLTVIPLTLLLVTYTNRDVLDTSKHNSKVGTSEQIQIKFYSNYTI